MPEDLLLFVNDEIVDFLLLWEREAQLLDRESVHVEVYSDNSKELVSELVKDVCCVRAHKNLGTHAQVGLRDKGVYSNR